MSGTGSLRRPRHMGCGVNDDGTAGHGLIIIRVQVNVVTLNCHQKQRDRRPVHRPGSYLGRTKTRIRGISLLGGGLFFRFFNEPPLCSCINASRCGTCSWLIHSRAISLSFTPLHSTILLPRFALLFSLLTDRFVQWLVVVYWSRGCRLDSRVCSGIFFDSKAPQ